MSNLRSLYLDDIYTGADGLILKSVIVPALTVSRRYRRKTSYFNLHALVELADGIDALVKRGGNIQLLIGEHDVPDDLIGACNASREVQNKIVASICERILSGLSTVRHELQLDKVSAVAALMRLGRVEVKIAIPRGVDNRKYLFHDKMLLFEDGDGDTVVAIGSINETYSGLTCNHENVTLLFSWVQESTTKKHIALFDNLWNNKDATVLVISIHEYVGDAIRGWLDKSGYKPASKYVEKFIEVARQFDSNFLCSGETCGLLPHQESTFVSAINRQPLRMMFADEVGLGKTIEVGATVKYVVSRCNAQSVLILCPQSLCVQWQTELYEKFGLDFLIAKPSDSQFVSYKGTVINKSVTADSIVNLRYVICSLQWARGSKGRFNLFREGMKLLPEVVVVDEAHAARVQSKGKTSVPSQTYRFVKAISTTVRNLILATATPMQIDPREFHGLLDLLGLPKGFDFTAYMDSLCYLVDSATTITEKYKISRLACQSIEFFEGSTTIPDTYQDAYRILKNSEKKYFPPEAYDHYSTIESMFREYHPSKFLCIRHSRLALEKVGYSFPKRSFPNSSLIPSPRLLKFLSDLQTYSWDILLSTENASGFTGRQSKQLLQSLYEQRLASSLYSCKRTLERRREHLESACNSAGHGISLQTVIKDIDWDNEDFTDAIEYPIKSEKIDFDMAQLNVELAYLNDLVQQLSSLLEIEGDEKIMLAEKILVSLPVNAQAVVFSRYVDTIDYFEKHCSQRLSGFNYGVYIGGTSYIVQSGVRTDCTKVEIQSSLRNGTIKYVLCSDAASEGLNLQSASVVINLDVPWNPARLEQRIGRVARLGQKKQVIDVYNIWYAGGVEEVMYKRLLERKDDFEFIVGNFPEILKRPSLEDINYDRDLTSRLNQLRNEVQVRALSGNWQQQSITGFTDAIRSDMIAFIKRVTDTFEVNEDNDNIVCTIHGTDQSITISRSIFSENLVSFVHPVWRTVVESMSGLSVDSRWDSLEISYLNDSPFAFRYDGRNVRPEAIFSLLQYILWGTSSNIEFDQLFDDNIIASKPGECTTVHTEFLTQSGEKPVKTRFEKFHNLILT